MFRDLEFRHGREAPWRPQAVVIAQGTEAQLTAAELSAQIPLHSWQVITAGGDMEGIDHHLGCLIRRQGCQELSPQLPPALAGEDVVLQLGAQQRSGFTAQAFDHMAEINAPQPALVARALMQPRQGLHELAAQEQIQPVVAQVTADLNTRPSVQQKLAIERLPLRPLPVERFADYEPVVATVRSTSTIELRSVTYSVPSRLIGQQLTVHLRHDRLDLFLRSQFVETLPRLHRRAGVSGPLRRIDFRHVIESLRRKPRALLRAQLQDDILPGEPWRQLWRQLLTALPPDEAAKVMVDALHVAARTDDLPGVERYLHRQLRRDELSLSSLRDHYGLRPPRGLAAMPQLDIPEHTLRSYDELLGGTPQPASAGNGPAIPAQTAETGAVPQPMAGSRTAGHSRWLEPGQLPLCPGRAGTPATAPGTAAAAVA